MQAVSRWERGGSPDPAMLPKLADALGVSIDELYNYTLRKPKALDDLLLEELRKAPLPQRLALANHLASVLFRATVGAYDEQGGSLGRMAGLLEQTNRQQFANPGGVPVLISYDADSGIMKSSVAEDFQYTLIMPEPEDGFAAIMKEEPAYLRLFALLEKPCRLKVLVFSYSTNARSFTASYMAKHLDMELSLAQETLDELSEYRLLKVSQIDTPEGTMQVYFRQSGLSLIPFLYFGSELMQNAGQSVLNFAAREKPLFHGELGENGITPQWTSGSQAAQPGNHPRPGKYGLEGV